MAVDLPTHDAEAVQLFAYEPERYWAVWQHPEGRYAYSYDEERDAWLIALGSQEVGEAYLASDARMNDRPLSAYRLDELSLPDAFATARAQPVPFVSSQGISVMRVLGVVLLAADGGTSVRHIPL